MKHLSFTCNILEYKRIWVNEVVNKNAYNMGNVKYGALETVRESNLYGIISPFHSFSSQFTTFFGSLTQLIHIIDIFAAD